MALINCPECGKQNVSESAQACPSCGFAIKDYFVKMEKERKAAERLAKLASKKDRIKSFITAFAIILLCVLLNGITKNLRYSKFSGEYYGNGLGPNVIHFSDDGTGHYYDDMHMYIFDYKLKGNKFEIRTHEEFLPIYTGELNIKGTYDKSGIFYEDVFYQKKDK